MKGSKRNVQKMERQREGGRGEVGGRGSEVGKKA